MSSAPYSDSLPCSYYTQNSGAKQGRTDGHLDSLGRMRVYPMVLKRIDGEWTYQQQYKKTIRVPADSVIARTGK